MRINVAKGGEAYQRVIPIGKLACYWVKRYIDGVRQGLSNNNTSDWLFLSTRNCKMKRQAINCVVKKYAYQAGLRKMITTHSFRVTCGTHMLKNDADIRYVQEQLGHRSIRTTQDYTRLVPKDLKRIHGLCHPREKNSLDMTLKIV